jgi:hypothetical protein
MEISIEFIMVPGSQGGNEQNRQNSGEQVQVPLTNFKKLLQDTLAFEDCQEFLAKLIEKAI